MANPQRGEVSFDAGGKTYTLHYSANALCELEDLLDKGIIELTTEMQGWEKNPGKIRFKTIRAMFWAGLRDHHPEIDVAGAGELVTNAGGILGAVDLIGRAFGVAFPDAKTKGARPPKGSGAGTGARS